MAALTKIDLANHLHDALGLSKKEAREVVEDFFDEIKNSLEGGDPVKLSGLGTFNLRDKKERPGRNPKTGKDALITPRRVATFKSGTKLKLKVSAYTGKEIDADE